MLKSAYHLESIQQIKRKYVIYLLFQRFYTIGGSSCGRHITQFSYAAVHVPGKQGYFDLTIHMDVQVNPGSATLPNCGRQTANFIHTPSTDNCPKLHYSRDQLMSFRPSWFSTKRLNPQLIRQLKYFNILKDRGKSGGKRVNFRMSSRAPCSARDVQLLVRTLREQTDMKQSTVKCSLSLVNLASNSLHIKETIGTFAIFISSFCDQ